MTKTKNEQIDESFKKASEEITIFLEANESRLRQKLTVTRFDVLQNRESVFLAQEVMSHQFIFPRHYIMTGCTDGKTVMANPKFWDELTPKERTFFLTHETLHCMFGHCDRERKGKKADSLWNIAADTVVNATLSVCRIGKPLKGCIMPTPYGDVTLTLNNKKITIKEAHKKTVEEVFNILLQHVKKHPPKEGDDNEIMDEHGNKITSFDEHQLGEHSEEERTQRENALRRNHDENRMRGVEPGFLTSIIDKMLEGKVNWKAELRNLVQQNIKTYQTWRRPGRRSEALGMRLPSFKKEGIDVAFYVDTSGSISADELAYFLGEIKHLFTSFPKGAVTATITFHNVETYGTKDITEEFSPSDFKITNGGTSHKHVFRHAEENNVKVAVMLTDGYSEFPATTTIKNLLWVVIGDGAKNIPFGKVIAIDHEDLKYA